MYIVSGSASQQFAESLSKQLNEPLAETTLKRFPDDENYVRILDDLEGEEVIIVQTTYPDPNIVELFLLQNAAVEAQANRVTVVIPYYGYGRQDQQFEKGEAISAKAIAKHISMEADSVVLIDPHKEYICDFFDVPADSCSAVPEIAKHLSKHNIDLVLAPDKGAINRARTAAEIIGCDYDFLEKKRIDGKTIEMKTKKLPVKNKKAAIIDDIISTGGTMAKAIGQLKQQGASEIIAACTHGLFASNAADKILSAGCDELLSTNTIQNKFSVIDASPCVASDLVTN